MHEISANMTLIYTAHPNKTQTIGLAIEADKKIQPWISPIPKHTTIQKNLSSTIPIKLNQPRAAQIKPTTNQKYNTKPMGQVLQ